MKRNKLLDEAQRAIERQQYDRAIRAYKTLVAEQPHHLKLALKLAELYLRQRALPEALALYHRIAQNYLDQGDQQRARSVYLLVIKIKPHDLGAGLFLLHHAFGGHGSRINCIF